MESQNSSNYYSLIDFIYSVKEVIVKSAKYFIDLLLKNKKSIFIFSLLGGISGGVYFVFSPKVFSSELVVNSTVIPNTISSQMISNLNDLILTNSIKFSSEALNMDSSRVKKIVTLEYLNFDEKLTEKYNDVDTVVLGLPFKIRVKTLDKSLFGDIKSGLMYYFDNNQFAKKDRELKKENILKFINKYGKEIDGLDSLKKVYTSNSIPRGNNNAFVFGQPLDPLSVYKEEIVFYKQQLQLIEELENYNNNLEVIVDFPVIDKPINPGVIKCIIFGLIGGLLVCLFYLTFKKLI